MRSRNRKPLSSLTFAVLLLVMSAVHAFATPAGKKLVLVTGAGGQTGKALFKKLLASDDFAAIGICRTDASKQSLIETEDVPADCVEVCDITDAEAFKTLVKKYDGDALYGLCIGSSAKPAPTGEMKDGRPVFGFPNGQPELVDWIGQKNQIDAMPAGKHVVVCSSMQGTDPESALNKLGRTVSEDGTVTGGNILRWKRKAEMYLIDSDKKWTIIHPGGLTNDEGGKRELVVGVDDALEDPEARSIPREDVAETMLQALRHPAAFVGKSFDLVSKPEGKGEPTTDFVALIKKLGDKTCDYSLGKVGNDE